MKIWKKIKCWFWGHEWVYVGRRTIFDILSKEPETKYICKHCGKVKR